ncbi:polysaccharide pyruvyl transferase family protein [Myroides marinus]|uniref:polysaccharide pyruvyl transferase family protein n=1 Tax=Myroides marinus TaxID=703342 RepID=UPI0025750E6E|nr:polysaccharide pyruvyl transferase family protein [Myroides marinus]MDM1503177.1 polysaccharide pyruvyl transferase family protein [Myroides marinus]
MKNIGIFTHPLISNYGGILQNFALQQALIKLGHNPITINRLFLQNDFKVVLARIKQIILRHHTTKIFYKNQYEKVIEESQNFIKKYIRVKSLYNPTDTDLIKVIEELDIATIIVGSDQVWRPKYVNNIYHEFLSFLPLNSKIKRISYAASFGTDVWEYNEIQQKRCKDYLKKFSVVSVRELGGIELCKKYFDRNAELVLDPTLLLKKEDYVSICNLRLKSEFKNSVFTYVLDRSSDKLDVINKVSEMLNYKVFENQPKCAEADSWNLRYNLDSFKFPSIEGWLEGFYNADFIVTDSFHGTVFAILFNKPFITIVNESRGKARFVSLLEMFDLSDRLVDNVKVFQQNSSIVNQSIDYVTVNEKVKELRALSLDFLKSNI